MAPKRQRINKGKGKAGSSRPSFEFPDEFSPDQGFNIRYWDRDVEEITRLREWEYIGDRAWRKISELMDPCRHYMPSKYVDNTAIEYFGIKDEVYQLLENIGWTNLLTNAYYSSAGMLHEFYVRLKLTKENRGEDRLFTRIEFQMGGFSFDYNNDEFAQIFWFNPEHPSTEKGLIRELGMSKATFWSEVNQLLFDEEKNSYKIYKATALVSRELKYVHRVLTHTVNGRADSNGNVTKWDQIALYCMVRGLKFNGIQMVLEMMHRHVSKDEFKGRACGGGLVMLLAVRHGFPPGGVPLNATKDVIVVDTAAFARVVYPPGSNVEEQQPEPEEPAAYSDPHSYFREIPDEFNLPLVAELTQLQNSIQKLDLDYQEEERNFDEYSMQYYQHRFDSMERWNNLYDSGLQSFGGGSTQGAGASEHDTWGDE